MARASKTPEQFASEMREVAPDVELLGAYANAREKLPCRCRTCGHEWMGLPNHLLRGTGCPACAGTQRLDAASFAERIEAISPTVELLSPYVNARTRVSCRCAVCGNVWETLPRSLQQGHACPVCGAKASHARMAGRQES